VLHVYLCGEDYLTAAKALIVLPVHLYRDDNLVLVSGQGPDSDYDLFICWDDFLVLGSDQGPDGD
jgi:hypothetical protein